MSGDKHSRGIIYYVAGEEYVKAAANSAESVKDENDIHITLYTDQEPSNSKPFDKVTEIDGEYNFYDKIKLLKETPYDKTLYLDSDTYITGDISDIFELLDNFDMVLMPAPLRKSWKDSDANFESDVPSAFPEFNWGVGAFNSSEDVLNVLSTWASEYKKYLDSDIHDQPIFREVIYDSDLRFCVLPTEYNCRLNFPGYLQEEVKIIHGWPEDYRKPYSLRSYTYEEIEKDLNSSTLPRAFYHSVGRIKVNEKDTFLDRLAIRLRERGLAWTLKRSMRKVRDYII